MQKTKAFTLIELLVVIAIIGILSGLIIVSMSGAQNAAKDARMKAGMDQFRSNAEIYKLNHSGLYNANGTTALAFTTSAAGNCTTTANTLFDSADALSLCSDVHSQNPTGAIYVYANAAGTAWCISSLLPGANTAWCIDSVGNVGVPLAATTCSTATACK